MYDIISHYIIKCIAIVVLLINDDNIIDNNYRGSNGKLVSQYCDLKQKPKKKTKNETHFYWNFRN